MDTCGEKNKMARDFPPTGTFCCSWAFSPLLLWVLSPHLCDEACQPCPRSCGGTRGGLVRLFHVASGNTSCPDLNIGRSSAGLSPATLAPSFWLRPWSVCPEASQSDHGQEQGAFVLLLLMIRLKLVKWSLYQVKSLSQVFRVVAWIVFFFFRFSSWSFFSVLFTWQLDHFGVLLL